jgi:hypothetical protein
LPKYTRYPGPKSIRVSNTLEAGAETITYLPYAFTEQGLAYFPSVLRSPRTVVPVDFLFQMSIEEWGALRSQIVISKGRFAGMRSQFVTASRSIISALPFAFTEQRVAMRRM